MRSTCAVVLAISQATACAPDDTGSGLTSGDSDSDSDSDSAVDADSDFDSDRQDTGECMQVLFELDGFAESMDTRFCWACDQTNPDAGDYSVTEGLCQMPDGSIYAFVSYTQFDWGTNFFDASGDLVSYEICSDFGNYVRPECRSEFDTGAYRFCTWHGADLRGCVHSCEEPLVCVPDASEDVWVVPAACGVESFLLNGVPTSCPLPSDTAAVSDAP